LSFLFQFNTNGTTKDGLNGVVGVEAGIALSANRESVFTIPNSLPVIGGKWGLEIDFILDMQYLK
jgi:hypothetical protein